MFKRIPNSTQRQSQFEDVEKSQLRAWLLVTKTFAAHADQILNDTDGINKLWFDMMSLHEKLVIEAKTNLLKGPVREQLSVLFMAAKKTTLAGNFEALEKTWSLLEKSDPDAKAIFETCGSGN
jgi:hypothetical protein